MYHHNYNFFIYLVSRFLHINWEAVSAVVLAITAWVLYKNFKEQEKSSRFLEYQIRPAAYPLLLRNGEKTFLYVRNDSKQKILFNFKVSSGDKLIQDFRDKPLNVFPGVMEYPDALGNLDSHLLYAVGAETFEVEYEISPSNVPINDPAVIFKDYPKDEWSFSKKKGWIGPDGIEPDGVLSLLQPTIK